MMEASQTPGTREGDDPKMSSRLRAARREGRKATIIMSIVAAGCVSLFIGRAIEVQTQNTQIDRSRVNCTLIQDDRRDRIDSLKETAADAGKQADNILGNKHPQATEKHSHPKPIPPADFSKKPFNQFAGFKVLIIQQARANRRAQQRNLKRAKQVKSRIENCNQVFPRHKPFWIF